MLFVAATVNGSAGAQPPNTVTPPGTEVTLDWTSLGLPGEITLVDGNINQDFTLPLPSGFNVTRLRGLIHAPVDFGAGFVEISDSKGRVLATVSLPEVTPDQAVVPFDVDISAAQADRTSVGLSFTVREAPLPPELRCGLGQRVVMSDLAAVFVGSEPAPTTIASFFPPVLQRLTIYAPNNADRAEQQAVLTLTSAVAKTYGRQTPEITVVNQARGAAPPPSPQFTRAVVVESGDAGLNVLNPGTPDAYLEMTGRGDQLADQVSLVANELQALVQVPSARVDKAGAQEESGSDEMSFGQLGISGKTSVLRTAQLTVGVDRSALGKGRVHGLQVHLLATHTPVVSTDSASMTVSANGQPVYTTQIGADGQIDAKFDVPGEFLRQRINFTFDLTFSPRQLCTPTLAPVTFQLDPRSTLTMRRGGPPLGGFGGVPSELSPEFIVALDGSSPNQLDYATRVVADIARLTVSPLTPRVVVDVKAAAEARSGALIVANAKTLELTSLHMPVGGESSGIQFDLRSELQADINEGLGTIQVFADPPRDRTVVTVTTSGAWTLVEPLFSYIDQLQDGWSNLQGDVLAAGPDGVVTNVSIGPGDSSPTDDEGATDRSLVVGVAVGAVALAVLAIGVALGLRRRRRPR
nr:cellulose synthase regulator protein [Mycolicibacterium malmesburyense]